MAREITRGRASEGCALVATQRGWGHLSRSMSGPVFLGLNVPWNRFGYDIGGGEWDAGWFDNVFSLASNASANAVRVFLHADARATPSYDNATHQVTGLPGAFLPELCAPLHPPPRRPKNPASHHTLPTATRALRLELVALARSHRLVLQLVLWSFDLCKRSFGADLISNSTLVEGYIARALEPMLAALASASGGSDHVVLELINEPEWCVVDSCTTERCIPLAAMQRFVGLLAAGVHAASPLRVTVGSASLKWSGSGAIPFDTSGAIPSDTSEVSKVSRPNAAASRRSPVFGAAALRPRCRGIAVGIAMPIASHDAAASRHRISRCRGTAASHLTMPRHRDAGIDAFTFLPFHSNTIRAHVHHVLR